MKFFIFNTQIVIMVSFFFKSFEYYQILNKEKKGNFNVILSNLI
jgi:hypothetical protein